MIAKVSTSYSDYFDFKFFIKFGLILAFLYYFNILFWGLTLPGGYYNAFISENLNYLNVIRDSLIFGGKVINQMMAINTIIEGDSLIAMFPGNIPGDTVIVSYECLGMGVTSFWIAFILAHGLDIMKTLLWIAIGVFVIWIINCLRIGLLMVALYHDWNPVNKFNWEPLSKMDHHDAFNVAAYVFIGLLIYIFYKQNYTDQETSKTPTS